MIPRSAMVLAAGLGKRMRPITDTIPKPMVEVAGRAMVDHVLDRLAEAGVEHAVVNVHHHADLLEAHLGKREAPCISVQDERSVLLDSGGGIRRALPQLGEAPFFTINADTIWIEGFRPNLARLGEAFDPERMDALLLLAATATSVGYSGYGDFVLGPDGRLTRRPERVITPFVFAGAAVMSARFFADTPEGPFSLNMLFDRAIEAGRLHGARLDGLWMHVGTPDAIAEAEACYSRSAA